MAMVEDVIHRKYPEGCFSHTAVRHSVGKRSAMPDLWKATNVNGQDPGVYQGWSQLIIIPHSHSKL